VIRIVLPAHLKTLAGVSGEVEVDVDGAVTIASVLGALEAAHPVLRGTIRDHDGVKRRPFVRFFIGEEDWSHTPHDDPLPPAVAEGREAFVVVGAMAGG
jgi:molybdopterin synthase sulfur carrier subunit